MSILNLFNSLDYFFVSGKESVYVQCISIPNKSLQKNIN